MSGIHIGSKIGEFVGSLISRNIAAEVAQGDYFYLFPDPELERTLKEAASIKAEYITETIYDYFAGECSSLTH